MLHSQPTAIQYERPCVSILVLRVQTVWVHVSSLVPESPTFISLLSFPPCQLPPFATSTFLLPLLAKHYEVGHISGNKCSWHDDMQGFSNFILLSLLAKSPSQIPNLLARHAMQAASCCVGNFCIWLVRFSCLLLGSATGHQGGASVAIAPRPISALHPGTLDALRRNQCFCCLAALPNRMPTRAPWT